MTMLDKLGERACWERFYEYKTSLCCPKAFTNELREFIDSEGYKSVYESIKAAAPFPLPKRSEISKLGKDKKRVVYTYPKAENMTLKLLTYLLLRRYDGLFSKGLFSFRPNRCAKDAVRLITHHKGIGQMYAYKADISNYFNSLPVERLLPELEEVLEDDELYAFLSRLLSEPYVIRDGQKISEQKGIMAGTPLSAFYANLYLRELDKLFERKGVLYARYSDDIIVFADTQQKVYEYSQLIKSFLAEKGLCINPDKEEYLTPETGWVFLGFCGQGGVIDIAPVTVSKLKKKMKRRSASLIRWAQRCGRTRENAAAAFIRIFNAKLFEHSGDNELSWALWFFPVINTDRSLRIIDRYAQECIRYIISGRRTKKRFDVRYAQIKALGYRCLVNEYYAYKKTAAAGK